MKLAQEREIIFGKKKLSQGLEERDRNNNKFTTTVINNNDDNDDNDDDNDKMDDLFMDFLRRPSFSLSSEYGFIDLISENYDTESIDFDIKVKNS